MDDFDMDRVESAFFSACDECLGVFVEHGFVVQFVPSNGRLYSEAVYSTHGVKVVFTMDLREFEVSCDLAEGSATKPSEIAMDPFGYLVDYKGYRGGGRHSDCQVDKRIDPEGWVKCKIEGERDFVLKELPEILSSDFILKF